MSTPPLGMKRLAPLATRPVSRAGRSATIFIIVAALTIALFTASSAASYRRSAGNAPATAGESKISAPARAPHKAAAAAPALFPALLPQAAPSLLPDAIRTCADALCNTPQTAFALGDTVYAEVTNGPSLSIIPRRVALVDASGNVREIKTVSTIPGTVSFDLPTTQTTTITTVDGYSTYDNRGAWKVNLVPGSRLSVRTSAAFTVSDPAGPVANLFLYNANNSGGTTTVGQNGTNVTYTLWLGNDGPDAASNVEVTSAVPAGTTFVSAAQELDPAIVGTNPPVFHCQTPAAGGTGAVTCTIDSLPSRRAAKVNMVFQIGSGTAPGTVIASVADIASVAGTAAATADPFTLDNTAASEVTVVAGAAETCSLECPSDMSRFATQTVDGVRGTTVTFSPELLGDCGNVTASPASGSFFPVGPTTVSISAAGGGSCSFTVTVTDEAGPTIACPGNKTATADNGACEASVDPGAPTASAGTTVDGDRDDGRALSDPYPGGVTTITWTATDSQGRAATCTQTVTVMVNDTTPPTITAPPDVSAGTGQDGVLCAVVIGDGSLGAAEADDNCSTSVKVTRTGVPAGNLFPVGVTTITYTATDGGGNTKVATQRVTVSETSPPIIFAPADATYTCLGDVPAASPSQAGGPALDASGVPARDANGDLVPGGQPYDNCGLPAVTVADTSTGAGTAASPKVITRTYTATDATGLTASAAQTITVIDSTAPAITAPADKVLYTGPGAASCGVTVGDLDGTLGTATASDNCAGVTVTRGGGNSFPVGDTLVTYTATDAVGNTATATQKVTVIDNTAPVVTAPADITVGNDLGSCSATLNPGAATVTDNCPGSSTPTGTRSDSQALNAPYPKGTTTITWTATDAAGNAASAVTQTVTVNDTEKPAINVPADIVVYLPPNTSATAMAVSYTVTAADNCPGVLALSVSPASGSTFPVGTTTVTATATDAAGNVRVSTFTVTVRFNFAGFFSPISNLPTFNVVNAGRGVPVKFSLSGNKGAGIFPTGSPDSQQIACDTGAPLSALEDTVTAGGSSLSYDPATDQYVYVWKTDGAWANTCRQLIVTLSDGTAHVAKFKFK